MYRYAHKTMPGPCLCGDYGPHIGCVDPGHWTRKLDWICSIYDQGFRLILASRHSTLIEAVDMGRHHERHGFYYRIELLDEAPEAQTATGTEG